jgi:hypothetical protein
MQIHIIALGLVILAHQASDVRHWRSTAGLGPVKKWQVDEICYHVRVEWRNGKAKTFELKRFEFEERFFLSVSILPIDSHHLFVTHEQGGFIVDDAGHVSAEYSPVQRGHTIDKGFISIDRPGGREVILLEPLVIACYNGSTVICREWGNDTVDLLSKKMKWIGSFMFRGWTVKKITPDGHSGWDVNIAKRSKRERIRISNSGQIKALASPQTETGSLE